MLICRSIALFRLLTMHWGIWYYSGDGSSSRTANAKQGMPPPPTSHAIYMVFVGSSRRQLSNCGLTDEDVAGAAMQACFDNVGRSNIEAMWVWRELTDVDGVIRHPWRFGEWSTC